MNIYCVVGTLLASGGAVVNLMTTSWSLKSRGKLHVINFLLEFRVRLCY